MPDPTAAARLATLAADYWEATLEAQPVWGTIVGDRRFDDRLDDPTPTGRAAHRARLEALLGDVGTVGPDGLVGEDRVTRSALLAQIESDLAADASGVDQWSVDPLEGPHIAALNLESIQPVDGPEQAGAMVARWNALGPWLDAHGENLRRELAAGRVAVASPVDKTLDELEQTLSAPPDELPFLAPLSVERPSWTSEARSAFDAGLRAAVQDSILPALERYRAIVRDEIRPAARSDDRPGLCHVDGGGEAYARLIEVHTSLALAADEIHAIGLAEVERIDAELAELGARVLGTGDLAAIRERLRTDPALHFATRDEVFAKADSALARSRDAIADWFGILPRAACEVVAMAAHEEAHSTIAYYRQPATDGSRPGRYYINTSAPETRPRYEAEALAYHEAIPGHHLQLAIAQELTGLPEFRRHTGPTAFFEGWGLYTERLSDEMGLYSSDLDRIGVLSFDGWRASRLVVDTGMHALGWTRRQAIDFMVDHSALARNNIVNEVDRYIVWPGQALAYKIGQREILRLRAAAKQALGPRFDIRAFHDAVLGHGAVGLATLSEIVGEWTAAAGVPVSR
ncbi:MAG TPA: DUF885 domain-containing protein [Candidatus Limnocylindrales bacterium]|nr:DUF885 domain-containing protein [Candidatus Limnocylindrales bacterium]